MRLGDFRKETAEYSDDLVLDDVICIDVLPGYYDGRPTDYVNHKAIYTNEEKIRFYMFSSETWFWDACDENESYSQNLERFLSKFVRGKNIEDSRWDEYLKLMNNKFREYWYSSEWQSTLNHEPELKTGKFYWFRHKVENIWRVGYVGQDPDENQYLYVTGLDKPWEVDKMDLSYFEFVLLEQPQ